MRLLDEAAAGTLAEAIRANVPWTVTSVEQKPGVERPAPPFTTSTLTQEASRKLGFSTERTMQSAQRLFQGVEIGNGEMEGLITYHRTDSTTLSDKALQESARVIREMFGAEYYDSAAPLSDAGEERAGSARSDSSRPTSVSRRASSNGVLDSDDLKIYELIWKRTMASQMVDARVLRTTVEISAKAPDSDVAVLTASGKAIEFAGFRRAYVEGSDDPAAELEEQEAILPQCKVGRSRSIATERAIVLLDTEPKRHETTPPARFTEASLIKELERLGIGRPSTFAPTIATIVRRGYVFRQGKALVPSFTAFAVTTLLRDHFGDFVETDFTAEMEEDLDEISRGERESIEFLREFYYGDKKKKHRGLLGAVEKGEENADYPVLDLGEDPSNAARPFASASAGSVRSSRSAKVDPAGPRRSPTTSRRRISRSTRRSISFASKAEGPRSLGVDPATGMNVYVMNGRYGAYVQLGETPEGQEGREAEARVAAVGDDGADDHARRGAEAALAAARRRPASRRRTADRDQLRPLRSVREAQRRVPIARVGRRRVQHLVRRRRSRCLRAPKQSRRRSGRAEEDVEGADEQRHDDQAARRSVRSVRDRRHHERVGAEEA